MILFDSLEKRVMRSKQDTVLLNRLLTEQQAFSSRCIQEFKGKYGIISEDDESTIALLALQEAMLKYEPDKGKFQSYARLVIQRRLIDEYRKNKKNYEQLNRSFDQVGVDDDSGGPQTQYEVIASLRKDQSEQERAHLKTEIELYQEALNAYDLTFEDLVEATPKNDETKGMYQLMAGHLAGNEGYRKTIEETRRIPIAVLEEKYGMQRKKIERGRRYILAVYILLTGDFETLHHYVRKEAAP